MLASATWNAHLLTVESQTTCIHRSYCIYQPTVCVFVQPNIGEICIVTVFVVVMKSLYTVDLVTSMVYIL